MINLRRASNEAEQKAISKVAYMAAFESDLSGGEILGISVENELYSLAYDLGSGVRTQCDSYIESKAVYASEEIRELVLERYPL